MSVLVKDMRFPNHCSDCEFSKPWGNSGTYCSRHPEKDEVKYGEGKPDWCPLVEVVRTGDGLYDTYIPPDKEIARHVAEVFRKSIENMEMKE